MNSTPPRGQTKTLSRFNNVRKTRNNKRPIHPNLMKTSLLAVQDPYGTGRSVIRRGPSESWKTYNQNGRIVPPITPTKPRTQRMPNTPKKSSRNFFTMRNVTRRA